MRRPNLRLFTVAAAAAIVLGALSTLGLAAASATFPNPTPLATSSWAPRCGAPALTGTVVNVTLTDMRGMMSGPYQPGPMVGGQYQSGPMMGGPFQPSPGVHSQWWPHMGMGMMRIVAGATGWTTLTLAPDRYELVCNLPGH